MSENSSENTSQSTTRETAALTGSGDVREGAQLINTTGLPAGFVPPSAALIQPASAEPAASSDD